MKPNTLDVNAKLYEELKNDCSGDLKEVHENNTYGVVECKFSMNTEHIVLNNSICMLWLFLLETHLCDSRHTLGVIFLSYWEAFSIWFALLTSNEKSGPGAQKKQFLSSFVVTLCFSSLLWWWFPCWHIPSSCII